MNRILHKLSKKNYLRKTISQSFALREVTMPAVSPTMTHGNLLEYYVKEGDFIEEGESVANIETDKANVTLDIQEEGYVAKIISQSGQKNIPVGQIIMYMVDEKEELSNVDQLLAEFSSENNQSAQIPEPVKSPENTNNVQDSLPEHVSLTMPALSPTMTAGKITTFNVKVGEEVAAGDSLATIETDKATMEFETQDDGYVAWINEEKLNTLIPLGEVCVILVDNESDIAAFKNYTPGQESSKPKSSEAQPSSQPEETNVQEQVVSITSSSSSSQKLFISPKALYQLNQKGYNKQSLADKLTSLGKLNTGSGPNGRFISQDLALIESLMSSQLTEKQSQPQQQADKKSQQPIASAEYEEIELSTMRRVIADRLSQSKREIPHYYLETEIRMDSLLNFKKDIQAKLGTKLSVNDFIIKAVARACEQVPETNSHFVDGKIRQFKSVDVR